MSVFIVATTIEVPDVEQKNFVVLGSYPSKDQAKNAVSGFANAVIEGSYTHVSIYEFDIESSHVYTFNEKDLRAAFEEQQKMTKELQSKVQSSQQNNQQQQQQQQPAQHNETSDNPVEIQQPSNGKTAAEVAARIQQEQVSNQSDESNQSNESHESRETHVSHESDESTDKVNKPAEQPHDTLDSPKVNEPANRNEVSDAEHDDKTEESAEQ